MGWGSVTGPSTATASAIAWGNKGWRERERRGGGRERKKGGGREKKKGRREGDARYLGMENNSDLCYILTQRIETSDLFPEVLPGEVGWREIATSCGCSASVSS